ncbi:HK97 family phage prohead protease [Halosquirtibacter laminarini]|uniref:HK97 family phage prohead protease n=1 Tax=Halosquirtibacter laminarini TaxID=3374600 RepID=A0AC61NI23_9BACT|nr:HK97 family phage prohead protease [Prolixibacteraceae bacterium]
MTTPTTIHTPYAPITSGTVRAIPENVEETRTITFIASSETKDRHGTILPLEGWELDSFNANPIIGYQHNVYGASMCTDPDPDDVIGKGHAYIDETERLLLVDITFEKAELNLKAEKIFRKVLAGTLNAVSVGFLPTEEGNWGADDQAAGERDATYFYGKRELLEVSVVNIPSNKEALKRQLRNNTSQALMYIWKALGSNYRISEIEQLRVTNILDLLEGKEIVPEEDTKELLRSKEREVESLQRELTYYKTLANS